MYKYFKNHCMVCIFKGGTLSNWGPKAAAPFARLQPLSVRYILVGILTHVSFVPWSACARLIPWNAILEGPHTLRPMVHHDSWSSFLARLRIRVDPKLPTCTATSHEILSAQETSSGAE